MLELLSPSNKEHSGRGLYLAKRNALLVQGIHLFELDLLLGGDRLPLERPLPEGDYYAMVSRSDRRPACDVYVWTIEATLPTLPVPLKGPDPDLPIDLGVVFSVTFERGRYARSLNYEQPPAISVPGDALERIERRARATE